MPSWKTDEDGAFFVDRSPVLFGSVLALMRDPSSARFEVDDVTGLDRVRLQRELDFYRVPIKLPLNVFGDTIGANLVLNPWRSMVTKEFQGGTFNSAALTEVPVARYIEFQLSWFPRRGGSLMVGLAPRRNFDPDGQNYAQCGWYLNAGDGTLYSEDGAYQVRCTLISATLPVLKYSFRSASSAMA